MVLKEKLIGEEEELKKGMVLVATQTKNIGGVLEPFDTVIAGHHYEVIDFENDEAIIKSKETGEKHWIPKRLPITGKLVLFKKLKEVL